MTAEEVRERMRSQPDKDLHIGPFDEHEARRLAEELHTRYGILAGIKPGGHVHVYCQTPRQH